MNKCPWTWTDDAHVLLRVARPDTNQTGQCEVVEAFVQCCLWNVKVSEIHMGLTKSVKTTCLEMDISYLSRVLVL